MARKHDVHVSRDRDQGGWKATQGGQKIANRPTQAAAEDAGRREAKKDGVDLVTHGRDGKIRSKDSFGNDPNPPKDTEH